MKTTLSTVQWQKLQALFDQAESLAPSAACALIEGARSEDALVAESLSALLSAHQQWQSHTGSALSDLADAITPTAIGKQLGAYRLMKEIGRGGMGVVYLGERSDGQVQQQVAIKVLHTRNLDANTRARFQREREILAAFDHPGIARLLDVGESAQAEPYYVMELLRGLPIDAHCDQHQLSIRERLHMFLKICDAVQYAHAQLILHRDIKPNNIIVDAAGVPKLIDFGIAKDIQRFDAELITQTSTHQRYFSPINAAPEQLCGEAVTVTCDVYQLGTLLHELLCGRPIFSLEGASLSQLEHKISVIPPDAPSVAANELEPARCQARGLPNARALARALQGDLDAIVQRALRKEPNLRYASVEQLSQDLERHLQDLPILGRRGNRAYRLSRFVKRNWRGLGIAIASVISISVFTALLYLQVRQTSAERDRAVVASNRAESVTEFLLESFRAGDPAVAKRSNVPIAEALQRASVLVNRKLSDEPETRAQVLSTLSEVYYSVGELALAKKYGAQSLELYESLPQVNAEVRMTQMRKNASVLLSNSDYEASTQMVERLRTFEAMHFPGQARPWQSRLLEANSHWRVDADAACKQAEVLVSELMTAASVDIHAVGESLGFVGRSCPVADLAAGSKRLTQLDHAIGLITRNRGEDDDQAMALVMAKAVLFKRIGRASEASTTLQTLLKKQERIFGPDSFSVANSSLALGDALNKDNRFAEAVPVLLRAHDIYSKLHGAAPSGDMAAVANNLAVSYGWGKVDPSQELQWRAKAYEIGLIAFGPKSRNVGSFATDYGALLRLQGQYKEAEPILRIARENMSMESTYGFMARLNLAMVLTKQQRWEEVGELIAECKSGDPKYQNDPYFKSDWDQLHAAWARHTKR